MVDLVTNHNVHWLAPFPIWSHAQSLDEDAINGGFNRPTILRFASDTFMEELLALLQHHPEQLKGWIALPETWREPMPIPSILPFLKINDATSQSEIQLRQKLLKAGRLPKSVVPKAAANDANSESTQEGMPFKLYQPAHKRFYLVATSMVCRRLGLPDRGIDAGKQEQVSFVVRRFIHLDSNNDHTVFDKENIQDYDEYAYVMTSNGSAWQRVPGEPLSRNVLIPEEERLPLFALNFDVDEGRRRRLLAGLIPVGNREAYMSAREYAPESTQTNGTSGTGQDESVSDLRMVLFETKVGAPWRSLLEQAADQKARLVDTTAPNPFEGKADAPTDRIRADRENVIKKSREQIQTISWYTLLDFAKFLNKYLTDVWNMVSDSGITSTFSSPTAEQSVFNALLESKIAIDNPGLNRELRAELRNEIGNLTADIKNSMREALKAVSDLGLENSENTLESRVEPFEMPLTAQSEWPTFYFPLADLEYPASILLPVNVASSDLDNALLAIDELSAYIEEALPPEESIPDPDTLLTDSQILDQREGWFVIRCVYERPNCGPFNPPIVSNPTEPFQLANFFDPDAPARPIRIPMPMDVSPAGLRKYKKNAALMISDMLCGKIKKIRKLTLGDLVLSVLPWPFHKDLPSVGPTGPCEDQEGNFGMFCSLSIPIVTLCALILLIIIVNLFDIFFRWVPYLFTCFKLPGFEAKK